MHVRIIFIYDYEFFSGSYNMGRLIFLVVGGSVEKHWHTFQGL